MKKTALVLAISAGITTGGGVSAASMDDRVKAMEKRLQYLEQRVSSQGDVIREKDKQISELSENTGDGWFQSIEFGGLVEVEAQRVSPDGEDDSSDIYVATVELGVAAQVNDWTEAEIVLLYEDEGDHSGEIDVDTGTITIADPDSFWFVTAGQYALAFGDYSTNLISDPITLDAAETNDAVIEAGIEMAGVNASAYVFKGDQETEISNGGLKLGYTLERDLFALSGSLGWINDFGESNAVVDEGTAQTNKAAAWTAFAQLDVGPVTVIGEYVAATEALDAYSTTDEPSAYNLEAAYHFEVMSKPSTFAVGLQGTDEASAFAGGLDEKRTMAALSMEILEGASLAIEYTKAEDYDGVENDIITSQLAVEF